MSETSRKLTARTTEHVDSWVFRSIGISAYADHLLEHNCTYRRGSEVIMHAENSYRQLIALEEVKIVRDEYKSDVIFFNKTQQEWSQAKIMFQQSGIVRYTVFLDY